MRTYANEKLKKKIMFLFGNTYFICEISDNWELFIFMQISSKSTYISF